MFKIKTLSLKFQTMPTTSREKASISFHIWAWKISEGPASLLRLSIKDIFTQYLLNFIYNYQYIFEELFT